MKRVEEIFFFLLLIVMIVTQVTDAATAPVSSFFTPSTNRGTSLRATSIS